MKLALSILTLLFLCVTAEARTGLKAGDHFENHKINGYLEITCQEGRSVKYVAANCTDNYISPTVRSSFVYDSEVKADEVTISYSISEDRIQSRSSQVSDNESSKKFNLWVWTIMKKPLLKLGDNTFNYELKNSGQVVETGSFDVVVDSVPPRTCKSKYYESDKLSDCSNAKMYCPRYFREMNDCQ